MTQAAAICRDIQDGRPNIGPSAHMKGGKKMQQVFYIPKEDADKYNRWMQADQVDYEENDIPRYDVVTRWSVDLGGGYEVDIKVCSSNYDDPLWCEGVLFLHGSECGCTEVSYDLLGEYRFEHNGQQFIVVVQTEQANQRHSFLKNQDVRKDRG